MQNEMTKLNARKLSHYPFFPFVEEDSLLVKKLLHVNLELNIKR